MWGGCVCLFLKWFEESCEQQVGETSSSSLFSLLLSCCVCTRQWKYSAVERVHQWIFREYISCNVCFVFLQLRFKGESSVFWIFTRKTLIRGCKIKSVLINMPFFYLFFTSPKLKPAPDGPRNLFFCDAKLKFEWASLQTFKVAKARQTNKPKQLILTNETMHIDHKSL